MKFKNKLEKEAFNFICNTASNYFSNAGCNDLEEEQKIFEKIKINRDGEEECCY